MPRSTGTVEHKGKKYNTSRDADGKEWWGEQGRPDSKIAPKAGKAMHDTPKPKPKPKQKFARGGVVVKGGKK